MQRPARCRPRSEGYTACGMWCCPPRVGPVCPRNTTTPARGTAPLRGRGLRAREGLAATPQHAGHLSRALNQVWGSWADVLRGLCARSPTPLRRPPAQPGDQHAPPRPTDAAGNTLHVWLADMQSRRRSHRAPSRRPMSPKVGPQIKSNQICSCSALLYPKYPTRAHPQAL